MKHGATTSPLRCHFSLAQHDGAAGSPHCCRIFQIAHRLLVEDKLGKNGRGYGSSGIVAVAIDVPT